MPTSNQYGGVAPSQLKEECEQRDSICATTEGFSDGQWYYGAAQVDFWDVWHQLATNYDLNPDATVMSGYSMGGFASYKLALEYPDLFAQAMPLEGPVICGTRVDPADRKPRPAAKKMHERGQHHAPDRQRQVDPLRDDLRGDRRAGPVHRRVEQVEAFNKLGYRYYAVLYPAEDHMVFALQNDFAPATSQLARSNGSKPPASFTFAWYPALDSSSLGIGPTGDYWISGLGARGSGAGQLASVSASSGELPEPEQKPEHHTGAVDGPTPGDRGLADVDTRRHAQGFEDADPLAHRRVHGGGRNEGGEAQVRHRDGHQRRARHADAARAARGSDRERERRRARQLLQRRLGGGPGRHREQRLQLLLIARCRGALARGAIGRGGWRRAGL